MTLAIILAITLAIIAIIAIIAIVAKVQEKTWKTETNHGGEKGDIPVRI